MRILIVKLGAIGDIVHTLPAFAAIRAAHPLDEISWVVENRSAEILRNNPLIDRLIEVDTRKLRNSKRPGDLLPAALEQFKELRAGKHDIAIDFQGLMKSGLIAKLSGADVVYGFSRKDLREPASRIFLTRTVQIPPLTHKIVQNIELAAGSLLFESTPRHLAFPIYTSEEHRSEAEQIAITAGGKFALLNPAGGWETKLWPAENYGRLADMLWEKLQLPSVIISGPGESDLAERAKTASVTDRLISVSPSLKGSYELAKLADVYVGGDTGPTHLAAAAGTPIVGIFGPTEWWRNGSLDADDICVERNDIACRVNCHRRTCSKWICMDISVETVLLSVVERLERKLHQSGATATAPDGLNTSFAP